MEEIKCPKCGTVFQVDEKGYFDILKQVHDKEFEKELEKALKEKLEQERKNAKFDLSNLELTKNQEIANLNNTISSLKDSLASKDNEIKNELAQANAKKDLEILELKNKYESLEKELASIDKDNEQKIKIIQLEKETEVQTLKNKVQELEKDNNQNLELMKLEKEKETQELKQSYDYQLSLKDTEIEKLKNYKLTLSTKLVGESLEVFCKNEFDKYRALAFPRAYFDKDNDSSDGQKGDFIYRDYNEDGEEFISIMFEMKNESEETKEKHKNKDFFKKLDSDRKNKNCEYAVLVSMLEADNEVYSGITDVSYAYDKMYVIRPQFLIPLITILRNSNQRAFAFKRQIDLLRQEELDVKLFEEKLRDFKDKFGRDVRLASDKYSEAIKEIDKTIKSLEKVKENLTSSLKYLERADVKSEELTVKKLTYGNKTMAEKFKAIEEKE